MNIDEFIEYWRKRLESQERELASAPPILREQLYWRDVFPYKVTLRAALTKGGVPVCCGDVSCTAYPTTTCTKGLHQACDKHASTCVLCGAG